MQYIQIFMSDSDSSISSRRSRHRVPRSKSRKEDSPPSTLLRKLKSLFVPPDNSNMSESESTISVRRVEEVEALLLESRTTPASPDAIRSQLEVIIKSVKDGLLDWVNAHVAFTGFDAVEMRKRLSTKLKVGDIFLLIIVGLTRGNNVVRIAASMRNQQTRKAFELAVKSVKVQKNVSGDYSAVTLSRVVACFPDAVCQILHDHELPMAVDYESLVKIYNEYPRVSRHQVCASIIPENLDMADKARALTVIMVPYLMTSEVINSKNKAWKSMPNKQKAEDSEKYLLNSYGSKILTVSERKQLTELLLTE